MKKIITLEIGNSSWWKNRKYRREAASEIRELREKNKKVKLLKKYQLDSSNTIIYGCLLYTSPSPRDATLSRMPSSA